MVLPNKISLPIPNKKHMIQAVSQLLASLAVLACVVASIPADDASPAAAAVGAATATASPSPSWSAVVEMCARAAPYCGVVIFLAPLPTIRQIAREKTVGSLPLLPYSSMVCSGSIWALYGYLKDLPGVWRCNVAGVVLGSYFMMVFLRNCGPKQSNLPGTAGQHLQGVAAVIVLNLCLVASDKFDHATDIIGHEGVFFCVLMFGSPLASLRTVLASRSAASIPLPFTAASLVNCAAWSVMGLWQVRDFHIYFPNFLGILCAAAQLALKCVYGNRPSGRPYGSAQKLPK